MSGLGLCYPIRPQVVAVRPDSPAAKAGLKPGDVINSLSLTPAEPKAPENGPGSEFIKSRKPHALKLSTSRIRSSGWLTRVHRTCRIGRIQDVELVVNKATQADQDHARARSELVLPESRLRFPCPCTRKLPGAAIAPGAQERVRRARSRTC